MGAFDMKSQHSSVQDKLLGWAIVGAIGLQEVRSRECEWLP